MKQLSAFVVAVVAAGVLAGCGYTTEKIVTTTQYTPPVATAPVSTTSQTVTTVITNPDGTVRRTS